MLSLKHGTSNNREKEKKRKKMFTYIVAQDHGGSHSLRKVYLAVSLCGMRIKIMVLPFDFMKFPKPLYFVLHTKFIF